MSSTSGASLLAEENRENILNQLLLDAMSREGDMDFPAVPYKHVSPKPGFCFKTKTVDKEKIFINVCQSENILEPQELTEDELIKILESDGPSNYRIPMSLGEPHAELDKSGKGCTVYDVIIHTKFFNKIMKSDVFKEFFSSVILEGIEDKYKCSLSREWTILKNKKFMGNLPEQNIRTQSKPFIHELEQGQTPQFTLLQEPADGYPEYMVAEISLPKVKSAESLLLDIGEDRLLLRTRSSVYYLDIFFPYNVIQQDCGAQFSCRTKVLAVSMPVQRCSS